MCLLYRLMLTECGRGRRNLQRLQIVFSSWASHLARVHVVVDAVTISSFRHGKLAQLFVTKRILKRNVT